MKSNNRKKSWGAMTAAELDETTKEFDRPQPALRFKPLTKAQQAVFERASRAGITGRELIAALNLDPELVSKAKAYAKRKKLTITEVVERGLRRELAVKD